jgi:hypothetical protein
LLFVLLHLQKYCQPNLERLFEYMSFQYCRDCGVCEFYLQWYSLMRRSAVTVSFEIWGAIKWDEQLYRKETKIFKCQNELGLSSFVRHLSTNIHWWSGMEWNGIEWHRITSIFAMKSILFSQSKRESRNREPRECQLCDLLPIIRCSTQPWASRDWPYILQFYWREGIVYKSFNSIAVHFRTFINPSISNGNDVPEFVEI